MQQRDHILSLTEDDLKIGEFEHQGQLWVVSYSEKRAEKDKHDREKAIKKLSKKISKSKNPTTLLNNHGHKKYLKIIGETDLSIDNDKIQEDARWDGLHAVITNLKNKSPKELFSHYRGL